MIANHFASPALHTGNGCAAFFFWPSIIGINMKNHTFGRFVGATGVVAFLIGVSSAWATPVQVYGNDFDGGIFVAPGVGAAFGGVGSASSVLGYAGIGPVGNQFAGSFWRNQGTAGQATTLTLTGLPAHSKVDLDFLLAIIESWDGSFTSVAPDYFTVRVDGNTVFSETFDNFELTDQSYSPPPGVLLTAFPFPNLVGLSGWPDSAYTLYLESSFHNIAHSSSTLTVEWFAGGGGWQAGSDEYWALENLKVSVHAVPEAGLGTSAGMALAGALMLLQRRRSGSH